jgi:hypothetical protein
MVEGEHPESPEVGLDATSKEPVGRRVDPFHLTRSVGEAVAGGNEAPTRTGQIACPESGPVGAAILSQGAWLDAKWID